MTCSLMQFAQQAACMQEKCYEIMGRRMVDHMLQDTARPCDSTRFRVLDHLI